MMVVKVPQQNDHSEFTKFSVAKNCFCLQIISVVEIPTPCMQKNNKVVWSCFCLVLIIPVAQSCSLEESLGGQHKKNEMLSLTSTVFVWNRIKSNSWSGIIWYSCYDVYRFVSIYSEKWNSFAQGVVKFSCCALSQCFLEWMSILILPRCRHRASRTWPHWFRKSRKVIVWFHRNHFCSMGEPLHPIQKRNTKFISQKCNNQWIQPDPARTEELWFTAVFGEWLWETLKERWATLTEAKTSRVCHHKQTKTMQLK